MAKMIIFDEKKCIGCKICELICSFTNTKEFGISNARIRNYVDFREAFFSSLTCVQCEDPLCLKACPTNAIYKENGVVKIESTNCIGCKKCVPACPFGNMHFDDERGVAIKCELCGGNPRCVEYCPTGALGYQEIETVAVEKQKTLFAKLTETYLESRAVWETEKQDKGG